jgi:hypothetical protein
MSTSKAKVECVALGRFLGNDHLIAESLGNLAEVASQSAASHESLGQRCRE